MNSDFVQFILCEREIRWNLHVTLINDKQNQIRMNHSFQFSQWIAESQWGKTHMRCSDIDELTHCVWQWSSNWSSLLIRVLLLHPAASVVNLDWQNPRKRWLRSDRSPGQASIICMLRWSVHMDEVIVHVVLKVIYISLQCPVCNSNSSATL